MRENNTFYNYSDLLNYVNHAKAHRKFISKIHFLSFNPIAIFLKFAYYTIMSLSYPILNLTGDK
jgi:hypothetical protein